MLKGILNASIFGYGFKERLIVFAMTAFFAGVGLVIGMYLDQLFSMQPVLAFAFVILSYPVAQFAIAKYLTKRTKSQRTVTPEQK